jgi:hypothetical protein
MKLTRMRPSLSPQMDIDTKIQAIYCKIRGRFRSASMKISAAAGSFAEA